jgi:hypothetical protein
VPFELKGMINSHFPVIVVMIERELHVLRDVPDNRWSVVFYIDTGFGVAASGRTERTFGKFTAGGTPSCDAEPSFGGRTLRTFEPSFQKFE